MSRMVVWVLRESSQGTMTVEMKVVCDTSKKLG